MRSVGAKVKTNQRNTENIKRVMDIVEDAHSEIMALEAETREAFTKYDAMQEEKRPSPLWLRVADRKLGELDRLLKEHAERLERTRAELSVIKSKVKVL